MPPSKSLLVSVIVTGLCAGPAFAQKQPIAFVGATLLRVSAPPIRNGTVLIQNGKIVAIGDRVPIPAGAKRIDARGKTIIPGLIDARSSLFLESEDLNAAGAADRDVLDAADFFDDDAPKVLARGVTTVYLSPGRRGALTGVGAVVKLRPTTAVATDEKPGFARVVKEKSALKATLGVSTENRSSSLERLAAYETLRTAFKAAQQYADSFARYERALKRYEALQKQPGAGEPEDDPFGEEDPFGGFGQQTSQTPAKPTKPRVVPAQEALARALRKEIPVRIEAHRSDDILNALRLAEEFGFRLILEGATEGHKVASEIARRKVPVIWGPAIATASRPLDTAEHSPGAAGTLSSARVSLAIATDGENGLSSRFILENAAAAAGLGLPPTAALRAVTLGAAEALGISSRTGSLDVGKDADLVVLSASPWDPQSRVEQVWVEGEAVKGGK